MQNYMLMFRFQASKDGLILHDLLFPLGLPKHYLYQWISISIFHVTQMNTNGYSSVTLARVGHHHRRLKRTHPIRGCLLILWSSAFDPKGCLEFTGVGLHGQNTCTKSPDRDLRNAKNELATCYQITLMNLWRWVPKNNDGMEKKKKCA